MPTPLRIEKLYAWIATETDGSEGIVAVGLPGMPGVTPLIGADRARIESYRAHAEEVARLTGCAVSLKVCRDGVVLDKIEP
jgi:hypothetical protein